MLNKDGHCYTSTSKGRTFAGMNTAVEVAKQTAVDLYRAEIVPAVLNFNYEVLRSALAADLQKYDILVTAETVKGAKELATSLNKTAAVFAERRKEETERVSGPIKHFESQMKSLETMCQEGRAKILAQVKKFEDETRTKCSVLLLGAKSDLYKEHGVRAEFQKTVHDDLILISNVTAKGSLSGSAQSELAARVRDNKSLQDRTDMRLVMLENSSFKAGLSAPLARHHVEHFLFTEESVYVSKLQSLLDAEYTRQCQAEKNLREKIAREEAAKAQQEAEQKAREERIRLADEEAKRAATAPATQHQPAASRATEIAENRARQVGSSYIAPMTPEDQKVPAGKTLFIITATLEVVASSSAKDEQVTDKVRSMLSKAGISESLKGLSVRRV